MPRTPRRRNIAPPREDVLAAVMGTVAERGLDGLTMAGLGREVGMSSGHLLYYFRTKDELLLQTLEWSEARLGTERRALLAGPGTARERLDACIALYVTDGHRDPHWTLRLEVWNRSQDADDDARARQAAIEDAWQGDLTELLTDGIAAGEFGPSAAKPDRDPAAGPDGRLQRARHRRHPRHRAAAGPGPAAHVRGRDAHAARSRYAAWRTSRPDSETGRCGWRRCARLRACPRPP